MGKEFGWRIKLQIMRAGKNMETTGRINRNQESIKMPSETARWRQSESQSLNAAERKIK